jgi:DNA mismatch endonuclease (patch repair protein)
MPKDNRGYWLPKIGGNRRRDQIINHALRRAGWRVFRVWEHELARRNLARLVRRIQRALD